MVLAPTRKVGAFFITDAIINHQKSLDVQSREAQYLSIGCDRKRHKGDTKMIANSKQVWEVGEMVKVGFLALRITAKEPTPGDYMPDAYLLTDKTGTKNYRFVPHNGLERIQ